jgi:hypothetical protein
VKIQSKKLFALFPDEGFIGHRHGVNNHFCIPKNDFQKEAVCFEIMG